MTAASMIEGPVEKIIYEEMVIAIKVIKPGKTAGPLQV